MNRRQSIGVRVGSMTIGGGAPVSIQSMCTSDTKDVAQTVAQIRKLEMLGCDIIRVAVYDEDCARALSEIKKQISIPLVADIHFSHRLAVMAIENGADKVRINPGNIGGEDKVREVVAAAKDHGTPIRVGVNSGSLEKRLLDRFGRPTPAALAESALGEVQYL